MGLNLCDRCVADCRHERNLDEIVIKCGAYKPPMTNADRFRAMSDEELASEMNQRSISTICDIVCQGDCKAIATLNKTSGEVCKEIIMKWLQQPAEENE